MKFNTGMKLNSILLRFWAFLSPRFINSKFVIYWRHKLRSYILCFVYCFFWNIRVLSYVFGMSNVAVHWQWNNLEFKFSISKSSTFLVSSLMNDFSNSPLLISTFVFTLHELNQSYRGSYYQHSQSKIKQFKLCPMPGTDGATQKQIGKQTPNHNRCNKFRICEIAKFFLASNGNLAKKKSDYNWVYKRRWQLMFQHQFDKISRRICWACA